VNSSENIFVTRTSEKPLFYVDPSLEANTAGTCDLFIVVDKHDFQLALKERRTGNLLAFEMLPVHDKKQVNWKDLLENVSSHSRLLRGYEFLKVTAGIMTPEFTLVPEALFKPGDENTYFKKNFPDSVNSRIRAQHVPSFHLYTIFGFESELENELNHLFQDPQFYHYSQALLTGIVMKMKSDSGKQLWLNVRTDKIDIIVSENKKLLLMNSFSWQTNEDILYYTLFVSEQLELNPEIFPMTVTGDIEMGTALHQLLYKYIRKINIPEKPGSLSFALATDDLPFHHYSLLYNLALCE
jgi:hypothetical protein